MTDKQPHHIKQLNLNIFTQTHFTKKKTQGMYGYYNKIPSLSGFEDTHFDDCLALMKQLPIYEKLGVTLPMLMQMEDEEIIKIRDALTANIGEANNEIGKMELENRKKKQRVKRTGR